MPFEMDVCVWDVFPSVYRVHCNVRMGELVIEHILKLDLENTGTYVLTSNTHVATRKWDNVARVVKMTKSKNLTNILRCGRIKVNRMHKFHVGDMSHTKTKEIYAMMESSIVQLKGSRIYT